MTAPVKGPPAPWCPSRFRCGDCAPDQRCIACLATATVVDALTTPRDATDVALREALIAECGHDAAAIVTWIRLHVQIIGRTPLVPGGRA